MRKIKNLILVGTSHISRESIKEVRKTVEKYSPDIIAIELDKKRFISLISNKKRKLTLKIIFQIGIKGTLFNIIGAWVEKKLGEMVGVPPGSEMRTAINLARKNKIKIALVDQDITITLKKLSKEITWKEKFTFIKEIIMGVFKKKKLKFDLRKVPDEKIIRELTSILKENYPSVYRILVEERNSVMAKNLYKLMQYNNLIVAIIGAGHVEGISKIIKNLENDKF